MDESSCSSDDDIIAIAYMNKKKKRKFWVHPILQGRSNHGEFHRLIQELRLYHDRFRQYFRMSVAQFEGLLETVGPHLMRKTSNYRKPIDPEQRLAVCLRFLSTGDSYVTIASSFRLGVSTVAAIVMETCKVIWKELKDQCMPVPTEEIWRSTSQHFWERWNFPNCLGAPDGKHVVIQKPGHSGTSYRNYKGTFSIVLLALVDADYRFLAVDVGAYGSNSDGGIFANSALGRAFAAGSFNVPAPAPLESAPELGDLPFTIVADDAFPLKSYIMKPYSGKLLPEDKRVYNLRLSRARRISENAFGILVQRWRVYQRRIQLMPSTVDHVIKATCVLCNFLRPSDGEGEGVAGEGDDGDDGEDGGDADEESAQPILHRVRPLQGNRGSLEANRVRDTLRKFFVSPAGSAPCSWQWARVRRGCFS